MIKRILQDYKMYLELSVATDNLLSDPPMAWTLGLEPGLGRVLALSPGLRANNVAAF